MLNVVIRQAVQGDLPSLAVLLEQLFSLEQDFTPQHDKQILGLTLLIDDPRSAVWVAEYQRHIIGMVTLQEVISTACGGPTGLLEDLVVDNQYRGRGVGKMLLNTVEEYSRELNYSRIQLLADCDNTPALDFYKARGWKRTALQAWKKTDI